MPYDPINKVCYLPNAAIAWKQPNGFYYPPAFHSRNLFFNNVDIRHFVIEPLFKSTGLFLTDPVALQSQILHLRPVHSSPALPMSIGRPSSMTTTGL